MNRQERNAYYRDYMRLRRAAEKAGYDVSTISHEQLFDMAKEGLIKPSARPAQQRLSLDIREPEPEPVITVKPAYKPTPVKPTRPRPVSSEVSELQQALIWFIGMTQAEYGLSENETILRIAERTGLTPTLLRRILQGKNPGKLVLQQFMPFIGIYRQQAKPAIPTPMYLPAPDSIPREAFPIAHNKWHTRLDQLDDFNRKRTI